MVRNHDHIFCPRNDSNNGPALYHSVYPLTNTQRSGRLAAGEVEIMPAPPEYLILLFATSAVALAATLAWITEWWIRNKAGEP